MNPDPTNPDPASSNPASLTTKLLLIQLALVLGVCAFIFFFGLGSFGLVGADEPRYAQIGREMLARHDWIVPTLNGTPWLEKPVLLYWQEMVSYKIFGVEDWVARVPAAMFAALLVLAVFFFMRRFRPGRELDAALITASCAGMIGFGRGASTDMQLAAPFCVAMLAWWTWHETSRKLWLSAFYLLLAVGALAKGPISPAMAVLIVAAYAAMRRDGKSFVRTLWLPGFALFFAVILPWYIAVQIKVPTFFRVFFLEHNLERYGTNLYQHTQPFWYYIPVFLLATMPWVVFTVPAIFETARAFWRNFGKDAEDIAATPERDWLSLFLTLWTLIPIVFFSISRSKLPGYILPAIPAATMLTAAYLHRTQKIGRIKMMLHSLVCGGLVAGALLAPWLMTKQPMPDSSRTFTIIFSGVMAIFVLVLVRRSGLKVLHFATLVPMVLALTFLLKPSASTIDAAKSQRTVEAELRRIGVTAPLAVFKVSREVEYGLNFYRNQQILNYERDGIPPQAHVVIAKEGNGAALQTRVGDRTITHLGTFAPQHLEFFRISAVVVPQNQIMQNHRDDAKLVEVAGQ